MGCVEAIRPPPEMVKKWSSQQAFYGGYGNIMLEAK